MNSQPAPDEWADDSAAHERNEDKNLNQLLAEMER